VYKRQHIFIFGLVTVLIGGSFLPVINAEIINNSKEYGNDKQQIIQITFQDVSEIIIVEKKNGDINVEELYQSSKYLSSQSLATNGYIIITADDLIDAVISSHFID